MIKEKGPVKEICESHSTEKKLKAALSRKGWVLLQRMSPLHLGDSVLRALCAPKVMESQSPRAPWRWPGPTSAVDRSIES